MYFNCTQLYSNIIAKLQVYNLGAYCICCNSTWFISLLVLYLMEVTVRHGTVLCDIEAIIGWLSHDYIQTSIVMLVTHALHMAQEAQTMLLNSATNRFMTYASQFSTTQLWFSINGMVFHEYFCRGGIWWGVWCICVLGFLQIFCH